MNTFTLRLFIGMILLLPSSFAVFGQEVQQMKEEISLSEKQLVFFELALMELKKHKVNSEGYKASLYQSGETYIVIFEDPNIPVNQRGSSVNMSSFEVVFDIDCQIVRANFSR